MRRINNPTDKTLERRVADVPWKLKPGVSTVPDDVAGILVRAFAHLAVGYVQEETVAAEVREAARLLASQPAHKAPEAEAPVAVVPVVAEPGPVPVPVAPKSETIAPSRSTRKRSRKGGVS